MRTDDLPFAPLSAAGAPAVENFSEKERRLRDLAARLVRTIGVARGLVRGGRTLNLSGMDDGVGLLCAQALDLPLPRGRALLPQIHEVLAGIEDLSAALHEARLADGSAEPAGGPASGRTAVE